MSTSRWGFSNASWRAVLDGAWPPLRDHQGGMRRWMRRLPFHCCAGCKMTEQPLEFLTDFPSKRGRPTISIQWISSPRLPGWMFRSTSTSSKRSNVNTQLFVSMKFYRQTKTCQNAELQRAAGRLRLPIHALKSGAAPRDRVSVAEGDDGGSSDVNGRGRNRTDVVVMIGHAPLKTRGSRIERAAKV
jgi:hypothetical protein